MEIKENYSLKKHNTFGVDVKAKLFCEAQNEEELWELYSNSKYDGIPKYVIGGGSNILFTQDYDGLIIKNNLKGKKIISEDENSVLIKVAAGEVWDNFVKYCVDNNYYGIENLSLIPGNVGAAPIQNIGAYGVEIKNVFNSLSGINLDKKEFEELGKAGCKFGYRDSIFKNEYRGKFIVTSVVLRLSKIKDLHLEYPSLKSSLQNIPQENITSRMVRKRVIAIRKSKLPDPKFLGNAGSFFKNPVVDYSKIEEIQKDYPDLPFYKFEDESYKIPAGWLIERCGWKGKRIGNVGCYEKQALIIVNYGGAEGKEILQFTNDIGISVKSKFDIELVSEVNII